MLASVSSSSSLPSMGRAVLTEGAAPAPNTGQDPAGTVHAESVRPVLPMDRADTDQTLRRSRIPDPATQGGGRPVDVDEKTYSIPSRLTLEIQKAREAIAETGGGLRAMQVFMQELAQQKPPSLSLTI